MDAKKAALIKTIAILLSITPETPLGQFLRLCLEAKVDRQIAGETPLEVAQEFVNNPSALSYWAEEIICADGEIKNGLKSFNDTKIRFPEGNYFPGLSLILQKTNGFFTNRIWYDMVL